MFAGCMRNIFPYFHHLDRHCNLVSNNMKCHHYFVCLIFSKRKERKWRIENQAYQYYSDTYTSAIIAFLSWSYKHYCTSDIMLRKRIDNTKWNYNFIAGKGDWKRWTHFRLSAFIPLFRYTRQSYYSQSSLPQMGGYYRDSQSISGHYGLDASRWAHFITTRCLK